ncbi:Heat shockprotein [Dirofilaria immitis]
MDIYSYVQELESGELSLLHFTAFDCLIICSCRFQETLVSGILRHWSIIVVKSRSRDSVIVEVFSLTMAGILKMSRKE